MGAVDGDAAGARPALDGLDNWILDRFRQNAEYSVAQMAKDFGMSPNGVRGRIHRLKRSGVLSFVAVIDRDRMSAGAIEAYVEVDFPGDANVHESLCDLVEELSRSEIRDAMTLIGEVDALIRVRAKDMITLRDLVTQIRSNRRVVGTRTRIVAGNWWHGRRTAPEGGG